MTRGKRRGRAVHGILLLDKPAGMTSNAALQVVKRLFGAAKAGHTGSLDPMATGLLPLCLGEATKVSGYLLDADKHYRFTIRLGVDTDTGDAEGEVQRIRPVPPYDRARLDAALAGLRGEIEQVPPMHSAVKQGGRPLYRLAHQGVEVERAPRTVYIHRLEVAAVAWPDIDLTVHCSKGTYVRTLGAALGERLGCGAHVTALRRTRAGPFEATDMVDPDRLARIARTEGPEALDRLLLPIDAALADWPRVDLNAELAEYIRQGQAVQVPGAPPRGLLRLYDSEQGFMGIGRIQDDARVAPRRLLNL